MSVKTLLIEVEKRKHLNPGRHYPMDVTPRGLCVIINIKRDREGSEKDVEALVKLSKNFGFEARILEDESHSVIKDKLQRFAKEIPSIHQCLLVFLMAHGNINKGQHIFWDGKNKSASSYYITEAFDVDHCKQLAGKPKVFVIQTCFGGNRMVGPLAKNGATSTHIPVLDDSSKPEASSSASKTVSDPPHNTSDMFWAHATLDDYYSYRSTTNGSVFIRFICRTLNDPKFSMLSIDEIFNKVLNNVSSIKIEDEDYNICRQQPQIINRLNKILMFNPGLDRRTVVPEDKLFKSVSIRRVTGTYIWPNKSDAKDRNESPEYFVANSNSHKICFYKTNRKTEFELNQTDTSKSVIGFKAGIKIKDDVHLAILKFLEGYELSIIKIHDNNDLQYWVNKACDINVKSPLALCEVNKDGIGILSGAEGYNKADFYVFSRKGFATEKTSRKIERFELFYKVQVKDHVAYHNQQIYVASAFLSPVLVFSLSSKGIHSFGRNFHQKEFKHIQFDLTVPNMVDGDTRGIIVVDQNGINLWNKETQSMQRVYDAKNIKHMWYNSHHVVLADMKDTIQDCPVIAMPADPIYSKGVQNTVKTRYDAIWHLRDGTIMLAENKKPATYIHKVRDGKTVKTVSIPGMTGSILNGVSASSVEHVVITQSKDKVNNMLRINTNADLQCELDQRFKDGVNPLRVFDINTESYCVLCEDSKNKTFFIEVRNKQTHYQVKKVNLGHFELNEFDTVCYTPNREFYVTSRKQGNIRHFDEDGASIRVIGQPGDLQNLNGIFVDREDNIHVLAKNGMNKYDSKSGKWIQTKEMKNASAGCYDGERLYVLSSAASSTVATYNVNADSSSRLIENHPPKRYYHKEKKPKVTNKSTQTPKSKPKPTQTPKSKPKPRYMKQTQASSTHQSKNKTKNPYWLETNHPKNFTNI